MCHTLGYSNVTRTWADAIEQWSFWVCSENYFLLQEFEYFAHCNGALGTDCLCEACDLGKEATVNWLLML